MNNQQRQKMFSPLQSGFARLLRTSILWFTEKAHAQYALAIMRIGFGAMTLIILLLHAPNFSYSFGEGSRWGADMHGAAGGGFPWPINSIFSRADVDEVLYIKTIILGIFALAYMVGYRVRLVGPIFAVLWLSFSTLNPVITGTGHFQTFRVLLIFLIFAQTARHWSVDAWLQKRKADTSFQRRSRRVVWRGAFWPVPRWIVYAINNAAVVLIAFQVCLIYVVSGVWKLDGSTWLAGTALYYPLRVQELALFPALNEMVWQITPFIIIGSWVGVYVQLLFPLSLLNRYTKFFALLLLIGMHIGIGLLLSLPFFSVMMLCADMIFIHDRYWQRGIEFVRGRIGRKESQVTSTETVTTADVVKTGIRVDAK